MPEEELGRAEEEVGAGFVTLDEPVLSLRPNVPSRLPNELNSAMSEAPKSSSPRPFSWLLPKVGVVLMVVGGAVGGGC